MIIGKRDFDFSSHHVYVMGILNITPDSFSDGGKYTEKDAILKHTEEMIDSGADIIDVGGESTRPGHIQISVQEEIDRVTEVIREIKDSFDIPVSIDTYKAEVAACALQAGADVINDIWGLKYREAEVSLEKASMAEVAARAGVPVILMHNDHLGRSLEERTGEALELFLRDNPSRSAVELLSVVGEDRVADRVVWGLEESVKLALDAGIRKENIILDPGIGFAKTQRENLLTMKYLPGIVKRLDYPVLLATSRKSMIGNALDLPADEREEGTIVTSVLGAQAGCKMIRVHDVEKNVRALRMLDSIMQG
ncbi:MAG: dihydropteroate synthase [Eubacterium sp.]|nr:dihydropteroate synthase [Eubacterium sp.]